jgi:hypothetical protein
MRHYFKHVKLKKKCQSLPLTDHGGLYSCKTWRFLNFLVNRLLDGGQDVKLTLRPSFTSEENWVNPRDIALLEGLHKLEKFNDLMET